MKNYLLLLGVLLLMGLVSAEVNLNREYLDAHNDLGNQAYFIFNNPMTMVGGGTCSSDPEDYGKCTTASCDLGCPSDVTGCALVVFDDHYANPTEYEMAAGSVWEVYSTDGLPYYFEIYYCKAGCSCSAWSTALSTNCGKDSCTDSQVQRTRTCTGSCSGFSTTGCMAWDACIAEVDECEDTDGNNPKEYGKVYSGNGNTYKDVCSSSKTLTEYVCAMATANGLDYGTQTYTCSEVKAGYVCKDGRCVSASTTTVPRTTTTIGGGGGDGNGGGDGFPGWMLGVGVVAAAGFVMFGGKK